MKSPPFHSKLFLHIFFKLCAHGVSHPPPLTRSALPTLHISPPMTPLCVSQPLLQQAPDWLLFLGIFWKEAGIGVPRSLTVYTHTQERAVTEWMRESPGERWSVASLPCILAFPKHSHIYASRLLSCTRSLSSSFSMHLFSSCWSKEPVDCLLAVDSAQASSIGAQSVPAVCFSVKHAESDDDLKALLSCSVLFFCSHAWLCAEMPEVNYFISVSWMFIQVSRGERWTGWEWGELARGSHVGFVNECVEVDSWWLRWVGFSLKHLLGFFDLIRDPHAYYTACGWVHAATRKISHAFLCVQS